MDFISLPVEIILSVFSFLSPRHIKETRLVCKTFCRYSSQYLIDSVFAGSQTNTLERLEAISKHDIFCKAITTVVYSTCSLRRDYATVGEYYEDLYQLRGRVMLEENRNTIPTKERCEVYWGKYREVYDDQLRVLQDNSDKTRITIALQSMPNIKHLVLSGDAWKSPAHPLHSVWQSGSDLIITPTYDSDDGPWQLSHGFEVMSSALLANKIHAVSLTQVEPHYIPEVLRSNCYTKELRQFFASLENISLYFNDDSIDYLDSVKNCLSTAKRLESLELIVETLEDRTDFTALLNNSWPNLTSISLQFALDYEPFVAFCRKHRNVRSLILKQSALFGGTWEDVVLIMRECFHLRDARIEGLTERDGEFAWIPTNDKLTDTLRLPNVEHYLVHGGANPFRSGALELESLEYL